MRRRFLGLLTVGLVVQSTVFAIYYDDLLFLRRPAAEIVSGSHDTFRRHAESALARPKVTVSHLETIASSAAAFALHDVEVAALERHIAATPADVAVHLRLADALRRAGRFPDAEAIYLDLLAASSHDHP